eukprot:3448209-Rhodomonas_salina.2
MTAPLPGKNWHPVYLKASEAHEILQVALPLQLEEHGGKTGRVVAMKNQGPLRVHKPETVRVYLATRD